MKLFSICAIHFGAELSKASFAKTGKAGANYRSLGVLCWLPCSMHSMQEQSWLPCVHEEPGALRNTHALQRKKQIRTRRLHEQPRWKESKGPIKLKA